jgi:hypothetical protein
MTSEIDFRAVALSGQPAPGTGGAIFGDFSTVPPPVIAVINEKGSVAFLSTLTGGGVTPSNNLGIWIDEKGTQTLIARTGDPAAGTHSTFEVMEFPLIADNNRVAFLALTAAQKWGIWTWENGTLELGAIFGEQAPGLPLGIVFGPSKYDHPFHYPPAFSSSGQVCIISYLIGTPQYQNVGMWCGSLPALKLVFQSENPSPYLPPGVIADTYITGPSMNGNNVISFTDTTNNAASSGLFIGTPDNVQIAVRQEDPAPGTGSTFSGLQGFVPAINDAGMYSFGAYSYKAQGIWANTTGNLAAVALEGQPAPGFPSGWTFIGACFFDPLVDSSGRVAFIGGAQLHGQTANGIWTWTSASGLSPVAIGNTEAPGTGGDKFEPGFPLSLAVNNAGQQALFGTLVSQRNGIWFKGEDSPLQLVALEQSAIPVDGKDYTLDKILQLVPGGGQNGRPKSLVGSGQINFAAKFTDTTSGVIVASVGG